MFSTFGIGRGQIGLHGKVLCFHEKCLIKKLEGEVFFQRGKIEECPSLGSLGGSMFVG